MLRRTRRCGSRWGNAFKSGSAKVELASELLIYIYPANHRRCCYDSAFFDAWYPAKVSVTSTLPRTQVAGVDANLLALDKPDNSLPIGANPCTHIMIRIMNACPARKC
jgi:hypothetical protein